MKKSFMNEQKIIALIAHDNKKDDLIKWIGKNNDELRKHILCGTGTTSKVIREKTGLDVKGYNSGPLGGDQQIGSRIVEGDIDVLIFFWDPLSAQPHDPDVKALLRIAVLYDIPVAMNESTADFIFSSPHISNLYQRFIVDTSDIEDLIDN